jgi:hypothetical protein
MRPQRAARDPNELQRWPDHGSLTATFDAEGRQAAHEINGLRLAHDMLSTEKH